MKSVATGEGGDGLPSPPHLLQRPGILIPPWHPASNWQAQAHTTSLPPPRTMKSTATSVPPWSAQATLKLPSVSNDAVELAHEAGLGHWLGQGRGARTYLILGPDSREA
jgi:hypothetical protein